MNPTQIIVLPYSGTNSLRTAWIVDATRELPRDYLLSLGSRLQCRQPHVCKRQPLDHVEDRALGDVRDVSPLQTVVVYIAAGALMPRVLSSRTLSALTLWEINQLNGYQKPSAWGLRDLVEEE